MELFLEDKEVTVDELREAYKNRVRNDSGEQEICLSEIGEDGSLHFDYGWACYY